MVELSAKWERLVRHSNNGWTLATNKGNERRAVIRGYAFGAAQRLTSGVIAADQDLSFLVSTRDLGVGRATFQHGTYDLVFMRKALDLIADEMGGDQVLNRIFIDIGANLGTTSIAAARIFHAKHVVSVEPVPENFRFLRCNVILNEVEDRVTCVRAAVSDVPGVVTMELSQCNLGDHRIRLGSNSDGDYEESSRATSQVDAVTLDGLLARLRLPAKDVGLLWIDTQGYEGHVLSSAVGTLASKKVPAVVEYWPYGLRRTNGMGLLHQQVADNYRLVIDVRTGQRLDPADLPSLTSTYNDARKYTDLVLIP